MFLLQKWLRNTVLRYTVNLYYVSFFLISCNFVRRNRTICVINIKCKAYTLTPLDLISTSCFYSKIQREFFTQKIIKIQTLVASLKKFCSESQLPWIKPLELSVFKRLVKVKRAIFRWILQWFDWSTCTNETHSIYTAIINNSNNRNW